MNKTDEEYYEVPADSEFEIITYGDYEERKKFMIQEIDEDVLDFFNKKTTNGITKYFLQIENVVAVAYQKPVKWHKYDHLNGLNVFDFGNGHVITFTKQVFKEWIRQNSIWINEDLTEINAQQEMLNTLIKILKINGCKLSVQDKKAKTLKFNAQKTAKDLRF